MATEHPNWVAERTKCKMKRLWSHLQDIVGIDVRRKNEEEDEEHSDVEYVLRLEKPRLHLTCRHRAGDTLGAYRFSYDARMDAIDIMIQGPGSPAEPHSTGTIRTRWDAEACQCRVVVKMGADAPEIEFPHDQLWKAVQSILEPFFFPPT